MRIRWAPVVALVIVFSYLQGVLTSPSIDTEWSNGVLLNRQHEHHHQGAPLLKLNETEVLILHSPTPPSYYTIDWEDDGHNACHGGFMILHGVFMCLAFFVSLPLSAFDSVYFLEYLLF